MSTAYHACFFAHKLSCKGGNGVDRLSRSLFDACVDLNPHQIEAAMFAMRSPVSKGVLLADEVGLGKTIEAGLVLCQLWAEGGRNILVICPASLRKQWAIELEEKFHIPTIVLDAKTYKRAYSEGNPNPFSQKTAIICSMHFASRRASEIRSVPWNMVVIDEAHKLRNAYRQSNRMGQNIKWAIEDRRKMLLTATPLQNSLLELYGLSTMIDEKIFGDLPSFKTQYNSATADLDILRGRVSAFCNRTLRRDVLEYIRYTQRKLLTRPFKPTEQEHKLYEAVSDFLKKEESYALPQNQRHLTALIVRKLLASSSQALAGTLEVMRDRLVGMLNDSKLEFTLAEQIIENEEIEEELLDELLDAGDEDADLSLLVDPQPDQKLDRKKLTEEIEELNRYIQWAQGIGIDTKSRSLLKAIKIGFEKMETMDAAKRAVIFTESRRTQSFLRDFLESNGYAGKVITFNGTNREPYSTDIYQKWLEKNRNTGRISGSRAIDVRASIIEHFRDDASILIATEAAAEGINLQFCSLVINYDLPWNPQRIEQRIGRCHRYGQKHDVVVINFLNERNEADRRVYELLNEKFSLFNGVFGTSDEVLGTVESGIDFERRILDIYQQCRTPSEIQKAFDDLRKQFDESIANRIQSTRQILLEHFDEDVHSRLKGNIIGAQHQLDRVGKMFWATTKFVLNENASFDDEKYSFDLEKSPIVDAKLGTYRLVSKEKANTLGKFLYRLGHPLGEHVIATGKRCPTPTAEVHFDISSRHARISLVENLKGKSGWLHLQHLTIDSFDTEDHLLFSGFDDTGNSLDQETSEKLFSCNGLVEQHCNIPTDVKQKLSANAKRHASATISEALERNSQHFSEARDQLEQWAEDCIIASEKKLHDTKEQIKALNRQARKATTLNEQHKLQEQVKELEQKKRRQRQQIFDIEDEIMEKRDTLIDALENRMTQRTTTKPLFSIRWKVI